MGSPRSFRPHAVHRMRPAIFLASSAASLWALLAGCGRDSTGPTDPVAGEPVAVEAAKAVPELQSSPTPPEAGTHLAVALDFDGEIDALRTRLLPAFEGETAAELERVVVVLATISIANDRPGAERALAAMRAALRDGAAGPADLDATRRTIDAMQLALEASPR
jgi:hypothetical protein